ncbi:WD repeat-containing protein 90 [Boleophthalmus pectinirostris]|uniref:WD repeat-containing protein 90 n=1 Tax=Boleophthalmus pectinirostris TaxID=150288 RepID=UPI00243329CC|nr:WD repeat-containing protein 90 [Boleophthalmus pectinirostris]
MASKGWQHPYVNIFKHVKIEEWKKTTQEGEVTTSTDKTLRCPVFRIKGPIPANSYILLPKSSSQSLGLTGKYFYLLFRPTPSKYFVVHIDVAAEEGQVVRISFSNMFKEFKSTVTWLQFPFLCGAAEDSVYENTAKMARQGLIGPAPATVRWTCLMLDLQSILSKYLNRCYVHLRTIKLCANMAVKNMFTSDLLFNPGVSYSEARLMGLSSSRGTGPVPRDMAFPVPRGSSWHDLYDYIRFPSEGTKLPFDSIQKDHHSPQAWTAFNPKCLTSERLNCVSFSKPVQDRVSLIQQITSPKKYPRDQSCVVAGIPELGVVSSHLEENGLPHSHDLLEEEMVCPSSHHVSSKPPCNTGDGVHVFVQSGDSLQKREESEADICTNQKLPKELTKLEKLLPDPILQLGRVIGFGGATNKHALWTKSCDEVVYPCHAVIVSMNITSKKQRFFIGHTNKVSALDFNASTTLLASGQTGQHSVVRIWDYQKGNCLAAIRNHAHSLSSLSFSHSGAVLCGVGKDRHCKTLVVVWSTLNVQKESIVTVLAQAHTDVDIHTMKVAFFDETRMVSCGRDNIRLWRMRNGSLRSCPVNLGEYHSQDFTDVSFEEGISSCHHIDNQTLYASSRSGYIFEIDYSRVVIKHVRKLQPTQEQHGDHRNKWTFTAGPSIAINSISISTSFCATGSEDGFLRLWPLDFSSVFLEAEHEGPVSLVSVSSDGLQVLAATSTGILGYLDVNSHDYNTLMRSHTDTVLGFSLGGVHRHLATASSDGTVRIWNMDSLHQLYDFVSEDCPCSVAFHPREQVFSCGFSSGIIRVFGIPSAKLLAEHKHYKGEVVGLVFSHNGEFMYSASSEGSLVQYDANNVDHSALRVVCNMVASGTKRSPDALNVSQDSRCLAFVGPSECIVTIADARTLEELLHIDVSILDVESTCLDSALTICFATASTQHLLVSTSANKVLWVSTKTGRVLREVSKVDKQHCSSLSVSEDNRFLLTAGQSSVKVWDYDVQQKSQTFIGHSQPICQVGFTPDQHSVISVGDAIFIWDFLAEPTDSLAVNCSILRVTSGCATPDLSDVPQVQLSNSMPRQAAPLPSSPPQQLDICNIIQFDHDAVDSQKNCPSLSSQICQSTLVTRSKSPASFLKVTELQSPFPLSCQFGCRNIKRQAVRPDCYRHFVPHFKKSVVNQNALLSQPGVQNLRLKAVLGYNGNGRSNLAWSPDKGLFVYSCGCIVVVEYLHTGIQKHLQGHNQEISCLAVTDDAQTVASGAGGTNGIRSQICIWDVQSGACRKSISHHKGAVQCLIFSKDDRFFLSVGDFSDPEVALWSSRTLQLLSSVRVSGPLHDAAFSPTAASQLACVGSMGVYFCLIHECVPDVELKVQSVDPPIEVGVVEMTALSYHSDNYLFTATNKGHVCVWDIDTQCCFMTWEADLGEIGVLRCQDSHLLTGSNTRWLRLWEVEAIHGMRSLGKISNMEHSEAAVVMKQEVLLDGIIVSAAFDNAIDMGIVGTTAGTLWYIKWSENSSIRLVSGHKVKVNDVVFSCDEKHFATCSEDGSVRVWASHSNELLVQFQVLNQACCCICWSPSFNKDNLCLAAGYSDGTVRVFRLASSEMEIKLRPHHVEVTAIQYSAKGHVILSAGKNGLVVVSSPESGVTLRVIRDHKGATITTIQSIHKQGREFGLEGTEMWLAASGDRRVSVWVCDWKRDKCELLDWLTFPAPVFTGDGSPPPSLAAFCPSDPSLVVYTGYGVEKELSFYSLTKKQMMKKIAMPHWATCFSISPKSCHIAVGSKDCVMKLIEPSSGRFQDYVHGDSLQKCHFSPSGALLFTVAFNEILLWEVHSLS